MRVTSLVKLLLWFHFQRTHHLSHAKPCEGFFNQTCISCVDQPLQLQCDIGDVITGFVKAGFLDNTQRNLSCEFQDGDCMDEPFPLFAEIAECLWKKQDCQFTLDPKGDKPRYGKCNLDSEPAYLMASQVECVAEGNLHRLCATDNQVLAINPGMYGFILSPKFPQPYAQHTYRYREPCTITMATAKGMGIQVQSTYMDLKAKTKGSCQKHYIEFTWEDQNGSHDVRHCGRDPLHVRLTSSTAVLTFVVKSTDNTNQGFALKYTAFQLPDSSSHMTTRYQSKALATNTEMPAESPSAKSQKTDCANQNTMYFFLSIALLLILFIILLIFGLVLYSVKKSHKMAIDEAREENQYRALTDMDLNRMDTTASVSTYLVDSV